LLCLLLLPLMGCDQYVEKQKHEATLRELADAKKKLADLEAQPKHHYQLREEGARTWRFDPDTGETCIQLASDADWKHPDVGRQSCLYNDALANGGNFAWVECFYAHDCTLWKEEIKDRREAALQEAKH